MSNHVLYEKFSGLYSFVFKPFFFKGIKKAVAEVYKLKPKTVLEVGTSPGYSLPLYSRDIKIVGLDVSKKMIDSSIKIMRDHNLKNCSLDVYDGLKLPYEDSHFDVVTSFSVITVVPDPEVFLLDLVRVSKSYVVVIGHFSRGSLLDKVNDFISTKLLGFSSQLNIDPVLEKNSDQFEVISKSVGSKILFHPINTILILKKKS